MRRLLKPFWNSNLFNWFYIIDRCLKSSDYWNGEYSKQKAAIFLLIAGGQAAIAETLSWKLILCLVLGLIADWLAAITETFFVVEIRKEV